MVQQICCTKVYAHAHVSCLALLPTLSKESTMIKNKTFKSSPLYCVLTAIQNNIGTFAAQKLDGFLRIQTLWRSKVLVLSRFFFRFEFQR